MFHPDPHAAVGGKVYGDLRFTLFEQIQGMHGAGKETRTACRAGLADLNQAIHHTERSKRAGVNTGFTADTLVMIDLEQGQYFFLR